MGYYEPEYWYEEPSEFAEKCEELVELIKNSAINQIKEELNTLKKENERMREIVNNYDTKVKELESAKQKYEWKEKELRKEIKSEMQKARLSEIMEGFYSEIWDVDNVGKEQPKCDKCDKDRYIHFKSPSGKDLTEPCQCNKKTRYYQPHKLTCTNFRICDFENSRIGKLVGWYADLNDDDCYTIFRPSDNEKLYKGQKYSEIKRTDIYFNTEEEAQKYADWLNDKKGE